MRATMLGGQHLRKWMLGGDVVWQKHRPKPHVPSIKDIVLKTLEHQGIKLQAINENGNLYFPMRFPARQIDNREWYRNKLTFLEDGGLGLSLQTIDTMLEADVVGKDMLFPMFFFDDTPPQRYDCRRKLKFIADEIDDGDGLSYTDFDYIEDFLVNAYNPDTDYLQNFEGNAYNPAKDFFQDFLANVYNPDTDYLQDFDAEVLDSPDYIADFLVNAYDPAKDFIRDFAANAYDPAKGFIKDFSANTFDPAKDFIKDFVFNNVSTGAYDKTFTFGAIQAVPYTKDFSAGAIQTIPYTKDFSFDAERRVSYTQDFTVKVGKYQLAGIVWAQVIGENHLMVSFSNLPPTLPQTRDRFIAYKGLIRMEKAHQWDTCTTAQTVRQDIINRIGHVSFKEYSMICNYNLQTVDIAAKLGQIDFLIFVSRGFSWTASQLPHGLAETRIQWGGQWYYNNNIPNIVNI
jgi:hypothetical protein